MKGEIKSAIEVLRSGGVLIYPTDTIWGIGCDATNEGAVARVFDMKQRSESKSLIILVDSLAMLKQYVPEFPEIIHSFLQKAERPTTVIYNNPRGLAPNVVAQDDTVAIRMVKHEFCEKLIHEFGKPLVSTSANISGCPAPGDFHEIDPLLLNKADYIVNLPLKKSQNTASQIIKVNDLGKIEYLRK